MEPATSWAYDTILITGGTGTFGVAFLRSLLANYPHIKVRLLSRDEYKQAILRQEFSDFRNVSWLLGDVRDPTRLRLACHGVDLVVHAAALKHVPIGEYNPLEVVHTNISGTENVIQACLDCGVPQAILLSSDKAVSPINLYGATKMVAEKLFIQGNNYSSDASPRTRFAVVRYGNVMGSRGSVLDVFEAAAAQNMSLPLTHPVMTRFFLRIDSAVQLVYLAALAYIRGGILVPHLPSFKLTDLARAFLFMSEDEPLHDSVCFTGIRPGEKVHERLMSAEEGERALVWEHGPVYCIPPAIQDWAANGLGAFRPSGPVEYERLVNYESGLWDYRLNVERLRGMLAAGEGADENR